jgi:hypothetical protein
MKRFLILLLTSLLASSIVISQTSQEPPELAEASELTKSVAKLFDEKGKVISAKDICHGPPYLSESSVKAALQSRFAPTQISGMPVKTKGVLRFNFVYQGTIWRMNPTLP